MYCVYGYRCSDAPFSAFMDECILYGMGGHKKQGSERGSTDRERVWKPRRALNQVELILRPFSLVKIILFFFHFRCLLWKTTKSVYSALGRRACFSSLNRGEYWPTMIPMLLIPPGSLQDWSHLALLPPPGPFLLNLWIVECLLFIGRAPRSFGDWIRLSYMFSFHGLFDFIFNVNPYFKILLSLVNKKK